ncbi:MAG TPA: lamin tail domain-containing protein [Phycisphaerae bacterium]|nr:lamin tail domain-containing protein [Phycisphaerae bacterium]HRW55701.1 lamin tail domain-containing protein [Phycisphaerae bacterium]
MKNWRISLILAAMACCLAGVAQRTYAQVVINEVLQNPEGSNDELWEYFELYGRPGMDLTGYAIGLMNGGIDANNDGIIGPGDTVPEIDEAFGLDGLTLGANGFLVIYNDTGGTSNLVNLGLIDPASNVVSFTAAHIPNTFDVAGKLSNDGSSTYVLVRKRVDHSIDMNNQSVYGANYFFHKDVRHDVDGDGNIDVGTETNTIGTGEPARMLQPIQIVDELAWSNGGGLEYTSSRQYEISDTPGFNPDMVSRLAYYCSNPRRGHRTAGNAGNPFTTEITSIADESFIYGEMITSLPISADFFKYKTAIDVMTGFTTTKAPTDLSAAAYDASCDPEPDDAPNAGCSPISGGGYQYTDIDVTDFVITPGTFNDHPTNANVQQFRFVRGDFNVDGLVNHIDERMILDRMGWGLDDADVDGTWLRQGPEFQKTLMMLEMDMADTASVNSDDLNAFYAECAVCGVATNAEVRITEFMYTGNGDEFIEFTNVGATPVDMSGFSYDDSGRISGAFDLSAFGVVMPGESVVITEGDAGRFKLDWQLPFTTKVIGGLGDPIGSNLGRGDEINLYDNGGQLIDRLTYDDRVYLPSPRANGASAWVCSAGLGANDPTLWRLSQAGGDGQSSYVSLNGDTGSPGTHADDDCTSAILPVGACCQLGACIEGPSVTQDYCEAVGGIYQGDTTTCGAVSCPQPSGAAIRITEYMYSGTGGEFIEITNFDAVAVDLTGWRVNDNAGVYLTGLDIGALGMIQPGESMIISEDDATTFDTAWSLGGTVGIVGGLGTAGGNNLGRNDQINLFDASGTLVDRLTYGDQDFPGTIRAQGASGRPCIIAVGLDNIDNWVLSTLADVSASYASSNGDIGNPGRYDADTCAGANPVGACCFLDGSCTDSLTQDICENGGGTWQGVDTTCATANCPQPSDVQIRITEWMYSPSGAGAEFVEFTNVGATPVDMTGWSYDDNSRLPNEFDLSGFGVVMPGESFVISENAPATFAADWSLPVTVKVQGPYPNNLGRSDEINLYDANDQLVDRLTYGDESIPGSIRTQGASGWPCAEAVGQNDVIRWSLSTVADVQNSYTSGTGDIGNPGSFVSDPCPAATGACCEGGVCTDALLQIDCEAAGGLYQGDFTTCGATSCPQPSGAQVRITEYMYSGDDGEFVELVNVGAGSVDMTGWRLNDSAGIYATGFDLSSLGTIASGEVVVITEALEADFRAAWGIPASVKIVELLGDTMGNNLGRADSVTLFDASAAEVDRLDYGDETFPGTIRTQRVSGWPCDDAVGQNDIFQWQLSVAGDAQGSTTSTLGDIGNPGAYTAIPCAPTCGTCAADADNDGMLTAADVDDFVACSLSDTLEATCLCADMDGSGAVNGADIQLFVTTLLSAPGACQ